MLISRACGLSCSSRAVDEMPGCGGGRGMERNGVGLAQGGSQVVGILGAPAAARRLVQRAAFAANRSAAACRRTDGDDPHAEPEMGRSSPPAARWPRNRSPPVSCRGVHSGSADSIGPERRRSSWRLIVWRDFPGARACVSATLWSSAPGVGDEDAMPAGERLVDSVVSHAEACQQGRLSRRGLARAS